MTEFLIPLYVSDEWGTLDQHPAYRNLLNWAWDDLDEIDDDIAKRIADERANLEISQHGGHTVFGLDGRIIFETREGMIHFMLKWG